MEEGFYNEQAYMEQEEEWEREGLLDPAWEKQQKKVIAKFINVNCVHITYNCHLRICFKVHCKFDVV